MYFKTIFHTLTDGTRLKFTIQMRIIDEKEYFYAMVINIDLDSYKNKSTIQQQHTYGIEITDGHQHRINYQDPIKLEKDLLAKYGNEWLETEI